MIENESVSKRKIMDIQATGDVLSELPVSIIHDILALVPIRDAVRTSILSRQWRYTWATLPHIVFDEECANSEDKSRCLKKIITHVLSHHKGEIHKFKMSFYFEGFSPNIDKWILLLSRKGIKELILDMGYREDGWTLHVSSSISCCEKLTKLKLRNCDLDPLPRNFKGFLFLRCLSLHQVELSSNTTESIVAKSPFLERLELVDSETSELRITAPNLKYMHLLGDYADKEICVYTPLLAEMSFGLTGNNFTFGHQQKECSVSLYTNILGGFTKLEKLTGEGYFVKYLNIGIESHYRTLVFRHLKEIELNIVDFEDTKQISVVARLIIGAPNLLKLKISTDLVCTGDDNASDSKPPDVRFSDFGCAPDFTFTKLRVVVMEDVSGFPSEVDFMVFLLQSSPVLETMTVHHLDTVSTEKKQFLMDKLLGCGLASPSAQVLNAFSRDYIRNLL